MKLKIERMNTKSITTSRGPSDKLGIFCSGKWYGAWKGQWNSGWAIGQTIDIPDDRVTSTEKDGKTFWNIAGPPKQANGGIGGGITPEEVARIFSKLEHIQLEIVLIRQKLDTFESTPSSDETTSNSEIHEPVSDDDIPF